MTMPATRVQEGQFWQCLATRSAGQPLCGIGKSTSQLQLDLKKQRNALLSSLRGQTIRIPDLKPLFQHWPTKTNPDLDHLRTEVNDWLKSTIPAGQYLDALQASDFGLFGATWWPCAKFGKLQTATYLAVWLFTWDDEIDINDGAMWDKYAAAEVFRDQTLAYVRHCLGIDSEENCPEVNNHIILNFAPIGAAIKEQYTLDQRKRVYQEMRFFMNMSGQEQQLRLSGTIPSIDQFWSYRLGSSAIPVCISLNEFSWEDMNLPTGFRDDEDVKSICRYTNTIVSATNDLLSLKKEIKYDAIESLVPILFHHHSDIRLAVAEVVAFIGTEIENMDNAAASLFRRYDSEDEDVHRQVRNFVDGCKHYTTGNLTWSLATSRYAVGTVGDDITMTL